MLLLVLLVVAVMSIVSGCSKKMVVNNEQKQPFERGEVLVQGFGSAITYTFKDIETGVWYIVGSNGGITPRLNGDGSLYVDEMK